MIQRHLTSLLTEALNDTPVVLLLGARQTGKSTLAKALLERVPGGRYATLDDPAVCRARKWTSSWNGPTDGSWAWR